MELELKLPDGCLCKLDLTLGCFEALNAQLLRIELTNKFYILMITFEIFKALNAQFLRKNFYI